MNNSAFKSNETSGTYFDHSNLTIIIELSFCRLIMKWQLYIDIYDVQMKHASEEYSVLSDFFIQ